MASPDPGPTPPPNAREAGRTLARTGALAASLLSDACRGGRGDPLKLEVVRDLALDLRHRLDVLSRSVEEEAEPLDALVEAALACADLATLAACNLPDLPEGGISPAVAAVHLAAGATRALLILAETRAEDRDAEHPENALRDARSAGWRADLTVRQVGDLRGEGAPG